MTAQALWTSSAMAEAMRAARSGVLPEAISGISIDSRTLMPGEAYFAIKGDVHDGHAFVDAALKNGAGLAVRGGSYRSGPDACSVTSTRASDGSAERDVGFRLVRDIE